MLRKPAHLPLKLLLVALFAAVVAVFMLLEIPCLIRHFTGLICPNCGMTRAWLSVLRLDLVSAFQYHPMFWSVPFLFLFLVYDGQLFRRPQLNTVVLGCLIVGLLGCYLIRLICFLSGNLPL